MSKKYYVDGFVIPMPKKSVAKYKKIAEEACKVWKKFGALDYKECVMDDGRPQGVVFTFPKMARAKSSDTVFFSFITYKSKKHRDEVNKKVMAYFAKKYGDKPMDMPFDMKKFSYGGFNAIVSM